MNLHVRSLVVALLMTPTVLMLAEEAKTVASAVPAVKASEKVKWLTSFDEAKAQAAIKKVPILANFSGSDWCEYCIRLDMEVFSKPEFIDYASTNLVLLSIDFPEKKYQNPEARQQNVKLARNFGVEYPPTVLLLDSEGKVLARTGYYGPVGAVAYVKHLQDLLQKK